MKKLFKLIYLLVIAVVIISCKSDDSDNPQNGEPVEVDPKANNLLALGLSAEDLLRGNPYSTLTVEIAYAPNSRPNAESVSAFRTMLEERLNKPGGINIIEREVPDQPGQPYTIEEVREIEDRIRTRYTEGSNIAVFIFFANGSSQNDSGNRVTLGTAYRNTSIIVYQRTLKVITEEDQELLTFVESFTMNHEFGHILGLTNIQNDDIHENHEDTNNAKHCMVNECLMFFELEFATRSSINEMMFRGRRHGFEVPTFDPLCIEDLRAKGGK